MSWWRRLTTRLFVSFAAVAVAGAAALLVTTRLLVPRLFDRRVGTGVGLGSAGRGVAMHDAVVGALDRALLVAVVVSLLTAGLIAVVVARRIVKPLDRVRAATRRIAAGHYGEPIERPVEQELAALADDVNALARSLAATEQRRAELVSDVAHELRTPLTTIRGYAEGMADGVIAADPDVLAAVLAEVDRLQRLAADLSTLSRADEGALTPAAVAVDLSSLVAGVVENVRPLAAAKGVVVEVAGGATTTGDPDRLVQVITNLVTNAITYTPASGRVRIEIGVRGGAAVVTVVDTGVGLAPDDVERVFERFYRVPGVERPPGGSGIGLAIARAIARAHHGELSAESPGPGRGTTFTLRLPAGDAAPGSSAPA
ncbi:MAG TPA: ATP-binding protein [Acidimicrobiales bacterium]|nr:ATP-binding protein [Acidimicrobiales bacterium]